MSEEVLRKLLAKIEGLEREIKASKAAAGARKSQPDAVFCPTTGDEWKNQNAHDKACVSCDPKLGKYPWEK